MYIMYFVCKLQCRKKFEVVQGLDRAMNRIAEYDETKKHLEFDGVHHT